MVVVVWLWIVPLLTCWMWRLGFTTSFLHGWNTVSQRMSPLLLLADCIQVRLCPRQVCDDPWTPDGLSCDRQLTPPVREGSCHESMECRGVLLGIKRSLQTGEK